VIVRRFPVDERDLKPFIDAEHKMARGDAVSIDEQLLWMENSVNSQELYEWIEREGENFDLLLFAPYLFATTFWGAQIHPERSVIIPCLHDEPYAYQKVFGTMFARVRGFFFNSRAEQALAASIYPNAGVVERSAVVGMGFELLERRTGESRPRWENLRSGGYLLYAGRKETGKNLDLLLDFYERLPAVQRAELPLVLVGSGSIDFRTGLPDGVMDLGFVSEEEKLALMRDALCLVQPSTNESFSIVLLEALREGTPVLVHGGCPVTAEHALDGDCGLTFANASEFAAAVRFVGTHPEEARRLGRQGREYVEREYSWPAVIARAVGGLERLAYSTSARDVSRV